MKIDSLRKRFATPQNEAPPDKEAEERKVEERRLKNLVRTLPAEKLVNIPDRFHFARCPECHDPLPLTGFPGVDHSTLRYVFRYACHEHGISTVAIDIDEVQDLANGPIPVDLRAVIEIARKWRTAPRKNTPALRAALDKLAEYDRE